MSASGSTVLRRLAASRLPSTTVARLPVRSVSVMTTRLAPGITTPSCSGPLSTPTTPLLGAAPGSSMAAAVSDSASRSTTRWAVPVPGATITAYPPVATCARSIAKMPSMSCWCPRADGAARMSSSTRRFVGQLAQRPPRMAGPGRRGPHLVEFGEPRRRLVARRRRARCRRPWPRPTTTPPGIRGRS